MEVYKLNQEPIATKIGKIAAKMEYEAIPESLTKTSKLFMLDLIGCIIKGKHVTSSEIMTKVIIGLGGQPQSTVIGYNNKTAAPLAALINGTAGHALDMDDDHREGTLHASVVVFPAVLAAAETVGAAGKDVITSYALGTELMIRLGESFLGQSYYQGFHPTGTTGVFGAALGVGKIFGLSPDKLAIAQGIAGSQSSGLLEWKKNGSWTKRFQAGHAARGGVVSALLAREGYTGPDTIYEGNDGFVKAFSYKDQYDINKVIDNFGVKWELADNSIKPHACCRFACPIVDAGLDISKNYKFKPEDIEDVLVKCNKWMITILTQPEERKYNPETVVDTQFSLPYAAAVSLVKKRASADEFTEEAIKDPTVYEVMQKVRYEFDPEAEKVYPQKYPSTVIVTLKDGRKIKSYIEYPKGDPENPVTEQEIIDKFRVLASSNFESKKVEKIIETVLNLEQLDNINYLTKLLR